jgi:uncharacterized protein YmfQ (DUF2313 family)
MYDRNLIDYLPHVIRQVREYKAIMETEQPEMVTVWQAVEDALNDQFINDATVNGVSRWEKILGIVPKATETLSARKFTILTRVNEQLPYTFRTLNEQLKSLCGKDGYSINLENELYTLHVQVNLVAKSNYNDVDALLKRIVPANMIIVLSLKYNQHETLAQYTHSYLNQFTQYQLRNEVLTSGN